MKTILVTGANAGMGFATAKQLAKAGMHVILYCRSAERGQAAQQRLKEETGNSAIDLVIGDLGSLASVRKSAAEINARFKKLDVLINNAGIVNLKKEQTTDGFEQMLGVNYVGHFELTRQLLPLLKRADAGRIVNVASGAYKFVKKRISAFSMYRIFSLGGNMAAQKSPDFIYRCACVSATQYDRYCQCLASGSCGDELRGQSTNRIWSIYL